MIQNLKNHNNMKLKFKPKNKEVIIDAYRKWLEKINKICKSI